MALSIWATPLLYELLPNPTWLIFLFVFIAIIRSLKIFDPPNKPEVVYSRNSTKSSNYSIGDVLEKCEILHEMFVNILFANNDYRFIIIESLKRRIFRKYKNFKTIIIN